MYPRPEAGRGYITLKGGPENKGGKKVKKGVDRKGVRVVF